MIELPKAGVAALPSDKVLSLFGGLGVTERLEDPKENAAAGFAGSSLVAGALGANAVLNTVSGFPGSEVSTGLTAPENELPPNML